MPRRKDIQSILVIGSGPIVIGQACEFDYSGTQACKVLKEEGFRVSLVNSNPATIMTDPVFADATYIEPITPEYIEKIIEKERPDAILPTMGGQTALNAAMQLHERGILEKYNVRLIGSNVEAIKKAEDRELFLEAMKRCGLDMPKGGFVTSYEEALELIDMVGFPAIIRPSFTLGGSGGGIAKSMDEFKEIVTSGLIASPVHRVLIEESILGWKEYELEVMRDTADNCVIICSIENVHPMGVHTGDSITVAPAQTLSDREYQRMRDASLKIMREIGVETGGSNVQFAVNPKDGRMIVIEMNPRVSRSSALASKATGFPIAKIAAKLAIGYTLDEILNDITKKTPACFEPSIDYVVTKVPRWDFEKFENVEDILGVQMKSVGEAMAIGRTFKESFQKALRSIEKGRFGFGYDSKEYVEQSIDQSRIKELHDTLGKHTSTSIFTLCDALRFGMTTNDIHNISKYDPWFIEQCREIVDAAEYIKTKKCTIENIPTDILRYVKTIGFSDVQLSILLSCDEEQVRNRRKNEGIIPVFKTVDTCAAEFESDTPYHYSTYDAENEAIRSNEDKIVILGSGPNRIGQGIEFDYCCVQGVFSARQSGYETIMINCNPETVSTDYDTTTKLYFEPLTFEDLKLHVEDACRQFPDTPILIDRFLEQAYEFDVDAVCDGDQVVIGGMMQHIEEAGVHSGDSSCVLPPYTISNEQFDIMTSYTRKLAKALHVIGLVNIQYAVQNGEIYVLEVNPRASRTIPFVAKSTNVNLAHIAMKLMLGEKLADLDVRDFSLSAKRVAIKESVFPFIKFPRANVFLGPEMRSTGEVMGIDVTYGKAIIKSRMSSGNKLPTEGTVFVSLSDLEKTVRAADIMSGFKDLGFTIMATTGTAKFLADHGIETVKVRKHYEGRPSIIDHIVSGEVQLVINTPIGEYARYDEHIMGQTALKHSVPFFTTLAAAFASLSGVQASRHEQPEVRSLQEYFGKSKQSAT
ncbi:MAG: carbamoyl-phosphate synthase large subunit [Bacteroidetes bacterium]|nr:carbamoyl-phosphate synthase large subunit [Bacteroidota bacterium]